MHDLPPVGVSLDDPFDLTAIGCVGPWPTLLEDALAAVQHGPGDPPGATPLHARVVRADRGEATVMTGHGPRRITWPASAPPPVTGDWVVVGAEPLPSDHRHPLIVVVPRRTALARPRAVGERSLGTDQVLAANMELVGLTIPIEGEPSIRRLERGLVMAYEAGTTPVVLLTKADIADHRERAVAQVRAATVDLRVICVSTTTGEGIEEVRDLLAPSSTLALLGASGAGKSTLTNALVGAEVLATQSVRTVDGRGRHTTTHRELVPLPGGGAVIDTPGLRTLGLGVADEGIAAAFPDIEALTTGCRFTDCRHEGEPGCEVEAAVTDGRLSVHRLDGWRRVRADSESAALRADASAWRARTRSWGRTVRHAQKVREKGR